MALVGSNCADVAIKAIVSWRTDVRCHPFDFGTMGASIPKILYLRNSGYSTAGLAEGLPLGPPFVWTSGDAYPGGTGTVSSGGTLYDFCSASLPAGGTFPGGSGTGTVNGLDYPYCATPTLGVGEQCMVTVSSSPTAPYATVDTTVNLAYSDASGPVSPNANRRLRGSPTGGGL